MNRKLVILFSLLYIFFMAILYFNQYASGHSHKAWVALGGIISGSVPLLITLFTKLQFDLPLVYSYLLFLIGSQFLGSIAGWYGLGWWDTFVHFISGGILAFTAIALFERLVHRNAGKEISSWLIFLFTLSFPALGSVFWEIYEFSCDQLFGTSMQGGNRDTMTDLIGNVIGGLVIAIVSVFRTKQKFKHFPADE